MRRYRLSALLCVNSLLSLLWFIVLILAQTYGSLTLVEPNPFIFIIELVTLPLVTILNLWYAWRALK